MDDTSSFVVIHKINEDNHDGIDAASLSPGVRRPQSTPPTPRSDGIAPRMREQDADLLETMHYAASQVSQYSPHGTPLLRPQDRSLPMEDVPLLQLLPLESTSDLLMPSESNHQGTESANSNNTSKTPIMNRPMLSSLKNDSTDTGGDVGHSIMQQLTLLEPLQQAYQSSSPAHPRKAVRFPFDPESAGLGWLNSNPTLPEGEIEGPNDSHPQNPVPPKTSNELPRLKLRRLLSGEVRTISGDEDGEEESGNYCAAGDEKQLLLNRSTICASSEKATSGEKGSSVEDIGTIASPVSVAQEAAKAKTEQEEGLAELRRRNEAIQFAKAVGEEIAINRNDLRIIEDNQNGDDFDDDDDDDEAIESKEITIASSNIGSHYPMHLEDLVIPTPVLSESYLSLPPPTDTVLETPHKVTSLDLIPSGVCDGESPNGAKVLTPLPGVAHHHRRKSRPIWPFEQPSDMDFTFMEHLSDGAGDRTNFVYKGIQANPPEITKRGIQRGNYAQLHRKAWLEVSDKYHRYGKNLRLYYRYWERLGFPTNSFFDWLDSKGEAAGAPLPNMDECPRSVLDSDTVLYITNPSVTDRYAVDIVVGGDGRGRVIDVDGDPVLTGIEGWIFVLRDNIMYAAAKITSITGQSKERFHHSSFFGGKAVASAGIIITDDEGYLTRLYPHSGHYRPGEAHTQRMLLFLHRKGVDLRTFEMDTQQLSHVSREKETKVVDESGKKKKGEDDNSEKGKEKEEKKVKKVDSLHLEKAVDVACK
jgi:hypothetical protein